MLADPNNWLEKLMAAPKVHALGQALEKNQRVIADGSRGSSTALLAGALALQTKRMVVLVVAHLDEADDCLDDLECFNQLGYPLSSQRFGALEVMPGESSINIELLAERLAIVEQLSKGDFPNVLIAPVQALMQSVPTVEAAAKFSLTLKDQLQIPPENLIAWLTEAGYQRLDAIEQPGDFAVRGGIIDIYPPAGQFTDSAGDNKPAGPLRLDYFGDEIDSIHSIDPDTQASFDKLQSVHLVGASAEQIQSDQRTTSLMALLPDSAVCLLHEVMELSEQARGYYERLTDPRGIISPNAVFQKLTQHRHVQVNQYSSSRQDSAVRVDLPVAAAPVFASDSHVAIGELIELAEHNHVIALCANSAEKKRLTELIETGFDGQSPDDGDGQIPGNLQLRLGSLRHGFTLNNTDEGQKPLVLVAHHEIFHRYQMRRRVRKVTNAAGSKASDAFLDLEVGDYVVHVDYGIARFTGLKTMRRRGPSGAENQEGDRQGGGEKASAEIDGGNGGGGGQEYLTLEFAQKALLHVPATQIDLIQKYVGGFNGRPPLSALGGKRWKHQKEQVAQAVRSLAGELLRVQAARKTQPGICYPADTNWQKEFEAEFPFDETEDQLAAIAAVKHEMSEPRPMDRLICGDVGFGKTEVAVRAAFKAAEYGKQVAILVPTTVLAEQHERTFAQRMADFPFRVESLSRFKSAGQQKKVLEALKQGRVDIIIGTHRLLSKDVQFADLGLVVIDEEQRFGVQHKQKLLSLRMTADVMTLTATPIPRTLHMSMIGLREISSLSTAPVDRRAIVTEVVPYDKKRIKQALVRELGRDGQVFFVHNRVHSIQAAANDIQTLVPKARIVIGHGQMPPRELEKVMLKFMRRQADILVATTIIESGIDIPTANTMFINEADHFGLAQLHQLRGRVGRYKNRAYCYLLLPATRAISEVAVKRLKALEQYSMLGAGFKISMRDLEIRGAGNLLGPEQSGHIAAVGYEMYCTLLEQETRKLKNETVIQPAKTHLQLPVVAQLGKRYIKSDKHRMEMYRKLSRAQTLDQLNEVVKQMTDAYGKPPAPAQNLVDLTRVRISAAALGVESIKLEKPDVIFKVQPDSTLAAALDQAKGRVSVLDQSTVYYRPPAHYLQQKSILIALQKILVKEESIKNKA